MDRSVRYDDVFGIVFSQVPGHQFNRFTGTDEQDRLIRKASENSAREIDCGKSHGDWIHADCSFAAHLLGHRKRMLEQAVENLARGARAVGGGKSRFHLAENLGFPQDHRIQAGCHPESVFYRLLSRQAVGRRR